MRWADWVTAPPCTLAVLLWLACLATERWFSAWVLTYVAQGLTALSVIPYLIAGEPGAVIPLALLFAALMAVRRLAFGADGPRNRRASSGEAATDAWVVRSEANNERTAGWGTEAVFSDQDAAYRYASMGDMVVDGPFTMDQEPA
jgi:hypothetical protein